MFGINKGLPLYALGILYLQEAWNTSASLVNNQKHLEQVRTIEPSYSPPAGPPEHELSFCYMSTYLPPWAQMPLFTSQGSRGFCVYSTRKGGTAGHDADRLSPPETDRGQQNEQPCECAVGGAP